MSIPSDQGTESTVGLVPEKPQTAAKGYIAYQVLYDKLAEMLKDPAQQENANQLKTSVHLLHRMLTPTPQEQENISRLGDDFLNTKMMDLVDLSGYLHKIVNYLDQDPELSNLSVEQLHTHMVKSYEQSLEKGISIPEIDRLPDMASKYRTISLGNVFISRALRPSDEEIKLSGLNTMDIKHMKTAEFSAAVKELLKEIDQLVPDTRIQPMTMVRAA